MNALFLINERSGVRRAYDVRDVIRTHWHQERFEIAGCSRKEDLDAIIDEAKRNGFDVVFAVGGDGTVHEVARRLIGTELTLGIVPTGSGNGFARHLGLAIEPAMLLQSVPSLHIDTIDTADVNGHPFLAVMGVGFDAFIAERFASSAVRGLKTYVREGILGYASYRQQRYELTVDGSTTAESAFVIAVANASQYGNNARIAPLASVQDGLLDVVIVRDASVVNVPLMTARLFSGSLHRSHSVRMVQGREVIIRRETAGPAHVDGEPEVMPEELRITIRPRSLKVLVPAGARI